MKQIILCLLALLLLSSCALADDSAGMGAAPYDPDENIPSGIDETPAVDTDTEPGPAEEPSPPEEAAPPDELEPLFDGVPTEEDARSLWETMVYDTRCIHVIFLNPSTPRDMTDMVWGSEEYDKNNADRLFFSESGHKYLRYNESDIEADRLGIRYGDYEWMQQKLRSLYTDSMIDKYFSYELDKGCSYIYRDGAIYALDVMAGSLYILRIEDMRCVTLKEDTIEMIFPQVYDDGKFNDLNEEEWPPVFIRLIKTDGRWRIDEYSDLGVLFGFTLEEEEEYSKLRRKD